MKRYYFISLLPFLLLLFSCGTPKVIVEPKVITEVREHTEYIHDTAFVEVPQIVGKVVTVDTTSFLENEWAKSNASVSAGTLSHSLETKPQKRPIQVQTQIVYRDSVVVEERVVEKEVERDLTWWELTKIKFGGWAVLILVAGIVLIIIIKK